MQRNSWFLAGLSALLLVVFWPAALYPLPGAEFVPPVGILVGFVPLMLLEQHLRGEKRGGLRFLGFAFLAMALFNLGTTWWVAGAHWSGVAATVAINGGLMALAWWGYAFAARRGGERMAFWTLVALWLSLEKLHA
jgi:apolipoprotein N-acyltransferase